VEIMEYSTRKQTTGVVWSPEHRAYEPWPGGRFGARKAAPRKARRTLSVKQAKATTAPDLNADVRRRAREDETRRLRRKRYLSPAEPPAPRLPGMFRW
jgi:hypothetical protein